MIFDAHFHVIDPRFPLEANQGFLPEPFGVADYVARVAALDVAGGAVVSGSFQAFDQGYLYAALAALGERFVGVTQLPSSAMDDTIRDLDLAGVRAVRFNFRRGASADAGDLDRFARRVHAVAGWHVELYADAETLTTLEPVLAGLPAVVIDHLGLERSAQPILRRLVARGTRVKATAFGRLDFDPIPAVRELLAIDPGSVVFGTDLPSTRSPRPFEDADVTTLANALEPAERERVFYTNALSLYRPRSVFALPARASPSAADSRRPLPKRGRGEGEHATRCQSDGNVRDYRREHPVGCGATGPVALALAVSQTPNGLRKWRPTDGALNNIASPARPRRSPASPDSAASNRRKISLPGLSRPLRSYESNDSSTRQRSDLRIRSRVRFPGRP